MAKQRIFDIAVIGAGPAGLLVGAACATSGLRTAVIGSRSGNQDRRTSALFGGSITLLRKLGVWNELEPISAPLAGIRIADASNSLMRAPEVLFLAREAGFDAFGYNVPNGALIGALEAIQSPSMIRICSGLSQIDIGEGSTTLTCGPGEVHAARLTVAADGRTSATRSSAGIDVSSWSYPQSAIVATFRHQRAHHNISTELHRPAGPLTVVPGIGDTSNLVWIDTHEEIDRIMALGDSQFCRELAAALRGLLGTISDVTPRQSFKLSGQTARSLAKNRVVVAGEAAHVIPPIGAQGLNLSCRDAATLAEIAEDTKRAGGDLGGEETLKRYERARRTDVTTRVFAVDFLNRSLLQSTIPGVNLARGIGLFALASSPALRKRVMREGILPAASNPAMMRSVETG